MNATTVKEEVGDECNNGEGGRAAVEYDDDGGRTETTTRAGAGTRGGVHRGSSLRVRFLAVGCVHPSRIDVRRHRGKTHSYSPTRAAAAHS